MKKYLKELRKEKNEKLIKMLNENQEWYNKWFDIYKCIKNDKMTNQRLEIYSNNINKIKKVFKERNTDIEFINGWEIKEV